MAAWLKQEGGKLFKAADYHGAAERLATTVHPPKTDTSHLAPSSCELHVGQERSRPTSWSGLESDAIVKCVFAAQFCEFRTIFLHGARYAYNQTDQAGTPPKKSRGGKSMAVSMKFQARNRPKYALKNLFFFFPPFFGGVRLNA